MNLAWHFYMLKGEKLTWQRYSRSKVLLLLQVVPRLPLKHGLQRY